MRPLLAFTLGALLGLARAETVVNRIEITLPPLTEFPSFILPTVTRDLGSLQSPSLQPPPPVTTPSPKGDDVTVIATRTVTQDDVRTVTKFTTIVTTITSTIVVTSTSFSTATVTSRDQETATATVYETSTQWVNMKRGLDLDLSPRTIGPAMVQADPPATTSDPVLVRAEVDDGIEADQGSDSDAASPGSPDQHLAKRDTITEFTTVTVAGSGQAVTVENTVIQTALVAQTSVFLTLSVITKTEQANARTTVTTTSTLTVTSTMATTGVVQTLTTDSTPPSTGSPTGGASGSSSDGNSSASGSGSSRSGGGDGSLSTGAKAGIGAGVGVGGLAVVAAAIWLCVRYRRDREPKPDHDDFMGASEVPVGGPVSSDGASRVSRPMSDITAVSGYMGPGRSLSQATKTAEGYRGTAMGDGRAGYAKPEPYGAAYAVAVKPGTAVTTHIMRGSGGGGDQLPFHPTPAESTTISPSSSPPLTDLARNSSAVAAAKWPEMKKQASSESRQTRNYDGGPVFEMPS